MRSDHAGHYVVFKPHPHRAGERKNALTAFAPGMAGTLRCLLELSWGANTNASGPRHQYVHGRFAPLTPRHSLTDEYRTLPAHQRLRRSSTLCEDRSALDHVTDDVVGAGAEQWPDNLARPPSRPHLTTRR